MNSFILKNDNEEKKVLLYEEKKSYSFTPKKGYKKVKKITVLDKDMTSSILEDKIIRKYNLLIKIIYDLISSDDTTSGDVLAAYTELDRLRNIMLYKYHEYLRKEFIDKYLKKLYILELELKKVHVMELTDEIEEQRGKGR
ncbi:MAG: hypothetical protein ACLUFU_04215 [Bacilli bacterium]